MAKNITVCLPWHMNGWNGTVCKDPKGNPYCSGRFSYNGAAIAKYKNEDHEIRCAGMHCQQIDPPPPCALSSNAFGSELSRCRIEPAGWLIGKFNDVLVYVPPYTVHTWPFEQMYGEEVKKQLALTRIITLAHDAKRLRSILTSWILESRYSSIMPITVIHSAMRKSSAILS